MRAGAHGAEAEPLGTPREVVSALAAFNTAPDGAPKSPAAVTMKLHGPGFVAEISTTQDEIAQILVTMLEEDIAWPVLMRIRKRLGWAMMDLDTGRTMG